MWQMFGWMTFFFSLIVTLQTSMAATSMPMAFTYQGRLMNSSGTAPLTASLTFYIEIRNPSGNCLLYSERQTVNTTTTDGLFSIRIGTGTRNTGVAGYNNDPGYDFSEIFTNKDDFPTVAGCAGGWNPGATDARVLRIHIYDGSTTTTLTDQVLSPVPQASVADTIDGVPLEGLTLNWTDGTRPQNPIANVTHGFNRTRTRFEIWNGAAWVPTTPKFATSVINDTATDGHVLKWNATTDVWEPASVSSLIGNPGGDVSGTYSNMTVEAIQGRSIASTAPNAGEVLKWNGTAWEPALDAGGVSMATGSGTTNRLTKFNASDEIADSSVTDDGTTVAFSTPIDMGAQQIKELANPTDLQDAVTLNYLESVLAAAGGISGTQDFIPKFNATGDGVVDSQIKDNGTSGVNFTNSKIQFNGTLMIHNSGSENIFVGENAGKTTATGDENVSMGKNALMSISTGYRNIAVGKNSLMAMETGNSNTGVGFFAMGSDHTGTDNIAIGSGSLISISGGQNNTAIGNHSGSRLLGNSSNNIMIGYGAGPTTNGALSSKLYVDVDQSDTPLIYGDFSNDYLRIHNILELPEIATPATPASGYGRVYFKSDGLYMLDDAGTESKVATGSGGGGVTGSGTTNRITKFTGASAVGNAAISETSGNVTLTASDPLLTFGAGRMLIHATGAGGNVAIGENPMYSAGAGDYDNVGVGNRALNQGDAIIENTAVGAWALYSAGAGTQSNRNSAFGTNALYSVTSGDNNTAVGGYSGFGIISGTNNTALGYGTGWFATGASSNNIFIGYNAGPTALETVHNKLYIDNSANDTPLIAGDFSANSVTINGSLTVTGAVTFTSGPQLRMQTFTSSGTFTAPAGTSTNTRYKITLIGGTGSGGTSTTSSTGGNGGAPGTVIYEGSGIAAGANIAVTVGTGGATAAMNGNSGNAGSDSTLTFNGVTLTAGGGGSGGTSSASHGTGGTATGGSVNIPGKKGFGTFGGTDTVASDAGANGVVTIEWIQ